MRLNFTESAIMTVDLHTMQVSEAKKYLSQKLGSAPKGTFEVEVIHGYRGGTALMNMVRKSFTHPRIKSKSIGLNQGSTTFYLK